MSLLSRAENIASYLRQSIGVTYGTLSMPIRRTRHQMSTEDAMAYSLIYAIGNRFQNAFVEAQLDVRRKDGRNLTRDEFRVRDIALNLIQDPNEYMSGRDLAMGFALDSRFLGTGYILTPREGGDPQGPITSLWWAPYGAGHSHLQRRCSGALPHLRRDVAARVRPANQQHTES